MRPFIIYRPGQQQRRRPGRPKLACKKCGAKRVPSDQGQSICSRCLKLEKQSASQPEATEGTTTPSETSLQQYGNASREDDGLDFNLLKPVSLGMHESHAEGETLDRFLKRFVPCMGIFMDASFFTHLILPATQSNNQVFNGALAVTSFHDLPMNDIWSDMPPKTYERYQVAVKWYRKSLKQSMESPPDKNSPQSIALSLLTITLYLGIELRQLNWSAQEGLVQAAFSIVHSARSCIRRSKNTTILLCLSMIMDFTCINSINPACISKEHWGSASYLAQRLCDDCNATENLVVRFELYRIIYDVTCVLHRGYGSDFELECRMQRWLTHLKAYEGSLPLDFKSRIPALRCRFLFNLLQIAWETYLYGQNIDRRDLNSRLSNVLGIHEINERNTRNVPHRPSWYLETAIVPSCLWVAWYWRSPSVLLRIKGLFERYQDESQPEQVKFVKTVLAYIAVLSRTPYDQPTQLEMDLFGQKPRVLQNYHPYRYIDYLIRKNKS